MAPDLPPFPAVLQSAQARASASAALCGVAPAGKELGQAGAGQGGGAGEEDVWKKFTPKVIDDAKCLARVWGSGFVGLE